MAKFIFTDLVTTRVGTFLPTPSGEYVTRSPIEIAALKEAGLVQVDEAESPIVIEPLETVGRTINRLLPEEDEVVRVEPEPEPEPEPETKPKASRAMKTTDARAKRHA